MLGQLLWFHLVRGLFLCYLGLKTSSARPSEKAVSTKGNGLTGAYASTFFLTLANPMTILSFAAIIAGLGIASAGGNYFSAGLLVFGVFLGSTLWWLSLSSGVSMFRTKFNARGLRSVNRISGIIITGFGLLALLSLKG